MERSMINVVSGGELVDKTPEEAQNLIVNMAANAQQINSKSEPPLPLKRVNEVSTSSLEQQVS